MTLAMAFSWILVPGGGDTVEDVGDRSQTRRGGLGQAIQVAGSYLGEFADQVGVVQEPCGRKKGMTHLAYVRPGTSDCLRAHS